MKITKPEALYCYAMASLLLIFGIAATVVAVIKAVDLVWYGDNTRCDSVNYINYGIEPEEEQPQELTK